MAASLFVGVHHIGICVRDLDAALATYGEQLGLVASPTRMETDEIRAALLVVGPELLEIFEPRDPTGPLGRFMERRGEGLHHIAYRVDDIEAALRELAGRGRGWSTASPGPACIPAGGSPSSIPAAPPAS